jgi:preprotein translocase subunit SecB
MADPAPNSSTGPTPLRGVPITVMAQYLKDLSFESPAAPASIGSATELREGSVVVDVTVNSMGGPSYEIVLRLKVEASHATKTIYLLEMLYGGIVQLGEVPAEAVEPLLMIEGPRLLFPYARAIVTDMTRDGGFAPLLINPIDFAALYRDFKRRSQQPAATPAAAGA